MVALWYVFVQGIKDSSKFRHSLKEARLVSVLISDNAVWIILINTIADFSSGLIIFPNNMHRPYWLVSFVPWTQSLVVTHLRYLCQFICKSSLYSLFSDISSKFYQSLPTKYFRTSYGQWNLTLSLHLKQGDDVALPEVPNEPLPEVPRAAKAEPGTHCEPILTHLMYL